MFMLAESTFQIVSIDEVPKDDLHVAGAAVNKGRPMVLVADDEKVIANTLTSLLIKSGFLAVAAYDGLSAFELAKEIRPQLVITDVVMPKMTGIELAIAVTRMIPDCKILLFSGQAATADLLRKAQESGYNFTTLFKPIYPADILRRAKAHFPEEEFPKLELTGTVLGLG
jgi:CheY-like chemotaxis protein